MNVSNSISHRGRLATALTLIGSFLPWMGSWHTCVADDRIFSVANRQQLTATSLGVPSVNETGDIVVRVLSSTSRQIVVFPFARQRTEAEQIKFGTDVEGSPITSDLVRSHTTSTLGAFPVINNLGAIGTYIAGGSDQFVERFDKSGATYTLVRIAHANSAAQNPFSFLSPIVGLDASNTLYFYGERTPLASSFQKRIYGSTVEVTQPELVTPIASTGGGFSDLETYVGAAAAATSTTLVSPVFRGVKSGSTGVYFGITQTAAATTGNGYLTSGLRPSVTDTGITAAYAIYQGSLPAAVEGVFLHQPGFGPRRAGNMVGGTSVAPRLASVGQQPSTYLSSGRIALNDFNQVAYVANDALGQPGIYTTNLGRSRRFIGVGDVFRVNGVPKTITGLQIFDGLKKNGDIVFLASVSGSPTDDYLLRASRGFHQALVRGSAFVPSYRNRQYLLRGTHADFPSKGTKSMIGAFGCNMVSTVNILAAYGIRDTPGEFHQWLLDRWGNPPPGISSATYIDARKGMNDFTEVAVLLRSKELQAADINSPVVRWAGNHNPAAPGAVTNLATIISELRQGYPVKLRLPNGNYPGKLYTRLGHYVIVYGLADPSKPDALIGKADLLIHDPGNGQIFTLEDYGSQLPRDHESYNAHKANWLEVDSTVIRYRPVPPGIILPPSLHITLTGQPILAAAAKVAPAALGVPPVQIVLTDSLGRRIGYDPAVGAYAEIPGEYFREPTYYGLDGEDGAEDPAWDMAEVQRLWVDSPAPGAFTIEIIGDEGGEYDISLVADGRLTVNPPSITGTLGPGGRRLVTLSTEVPPERSALQLRIEQIAPALIRIKAASVTGSTYQLQRSTAFSGWTSEGSAKPGTGSDLEWDISTDGQTAAFYRALITTP